MTQDRLADLVGLPEVDGNTIAQLEGGRKKYLPEQPMLGALARALGVSEVSLLKEAGVITEDLPALGAPQDLFPVTELRGQIVRALKRTHASDYKLRAILMLLEEDAD